MMEIFSYVIIMFILAVASFALYVMISNPEECYACGHRFEKKWDRFTTAQGKHLCRSCWGKYAVPVNQPAPLIGVNHNPVFTEKDLTLKIYKNDKLRIKPNPFRINENFDTPSIVSKKWMCFCPLGKGWNGWGDTPFEAYTDWIKHNGTK